jgi:xanthine dehydrogenase accessory factor
LDESSGHGTSKYKIEPFFYEENYGKIYEYIKKPYSVLIFGTGAHVTSFISYGKFNVLENYSY